jgi:hypothetical protein
LRAPTRFPFVALVFTKKLRDYGMGL